MRRARIKDATDNYGNSVATGDKVVFSWAGDLYKGIIQSIRPVNHNNRTSMASRFQMEVCPLDAEGYECDVNVTVKDSRSTVKI